MSSKALKPKSAEFALYDESESALLFAHMEFVLVLGASNTESTNIVQTTYT